MVDQTVTLSRPTTLSTPAWRLDRRFREHLTGYVLSLPAFVLMGMLLIGPVLMVLVMSFTDYGLGEPEWRFIGLDNYQEMLETEVFWQALRNTFVHVVIVVPVSVFLGLGVPLPIDSCSIWKSFYRAVYFLPVMATLVAMATVWLVVLNPDFGLLNITLGLVGIKGATG